LYDRNTNHLVEADSLACNRTFIDYWEPVTGPQPAVGPQARTNKPRIAPSIPMTTTDPWGGRGVVTGNTPAGGTPAVTPEETARAGKGREVPQLSLVTPDFEAGQAEAPQEAAKVTRQLPHVPSPPDLFGEADEAQVAVGGAPNAKPKSQGGKGLAGLLNSTRNRIILLLIVLVALAAAGGGVLLVRGQQGMTPAVVAPSPTATQPLPTPTGFGDATPTPPPTPTTPLPPPNVVGVNGWVQVTSNGLNVRESPSPSGRRVAVIPGGTKARVLEGPVDAGGFTWWRIEGFDPKNPSRSGWCAGQFLKPVPPP
jgi:hypothetical protein